MRLEDALGLDMAEVLPGDKRKAVEALRDRLAALTTEQRAAIQLLHEAIELGVEHFDTAEMYAAGGAEEVVGHGPGGVHAADAAVDGGGLGNLRDGIAGPSLGPVLSSLIHQGVETLEQAAFLREKGCAFAQGFFFSKPLPEAAMTALLPGAPRRASWNG